jgi:MFS family permease
VLLLGVVPEPRLTLVLLLLQSAWVVCFFPAGFALIAVLFPPELRSFGVSIAGTTGTLVGAGGVPALIGLLADVASFRLAFVLIGLVALASPLVLRFGRQPTA